MVNFSQHTARIINRLGQPVTLTPAGGQARVVNAVFTSRPDLGMLVAGYAPGLRVAAADAAGLTIGAAVAIGAKQFKIAEIHDDGDDGGDVLYQLESA